MAEHYKANPDDRSDNAEKLQEMVQNTIDNIHDAKAAIPHSSEQDCAAIEAKNEHRLESIQKMKAEIKEESQYRK
ncbi:small acid-soluble spore protein Tlp [Bacillus manliponensis]|uniref:Small, acid-soluble spore protein Tlp n=1 Tax=Bacillus manliponensis TaxID=574376 RepID=A0A073JX95_9BACI|nr:small acid-soluble spore protein Tlp [Bacillus manliponensis]KEK18832.1 small acid-soluble spore protein Tlp [Bacillus manliponensis]